MNTKYMLLILGSFVIVSSLFMYLMLSGNLDFFIVKLKWFLRVFIPFFIIYLFYLGNKI